ncbi:hypothetical protein [Mycobacteroides salmoniphilum]|uniref:Uncharacterized protein n=1 Tax=Mycobacteroides salmoniphilum TaxID=404941 RepID=A0A4R8SDK8_9MYCO|nr:hypothetical protein [Mycobacteroides salmoniphilum]TDZ93540.1 hypothetical protein CCUG60885_03143 [Mycobacteroides salmoniphilum]TEA09323.1 hypothetical protein CCUG60883_00084 [Mycobacteroides salmoniphilum]
MTGHVVNLDYIPSDLRRIAQMWFIWREIVLRGMNRAPGQEGSDVTGYDYWGDVPPRFEGDCLNLYSGGNDYVQIIRRARDGIAIDIEQRGLAGNAGFLRQISDVEKYLLLGTADSVRMSLGLPRRDVSWYQAGLDSRVHLRNLDPEAEYSTRFEMSVEGEPSDRGWLAEIDAVTFSHLLEMTYGDLDSLMREGIPSDWFTVTFE